MKLNAYLSFDDQCEAAFKFYAQCLGGKIDTMSTFAEMPGSGDMAPQYRNRIMHACLSVGDQQLMGSDSMPGYPYEGIKGMTVAIIVDSATEAERVFNALAAGGTVRMPLEETFWAARFGMLVDRYGVPWMVNCNKGDCTAEK